MEVALVAPFRELGLLLREREPVQEQFWLVLAQELQQPGSAILGLSVERFLLGAYLHSNPQPGLAWGEWLNEMSHSLVRLFRRVEDALADSAVLG